MLMDDLNDKRLYNTNPVNMYGYMKRNVYNEELDGSAELIREEMDCLKEKVGTIIGHKGVVIQEIMRKSNCRISIDQDFPEGQPHKVKITSSKQENIDVAKELISRVIELGPASLNSSGIKDDSPVETYSMECPQDKVGIVIGARGVVINDIMRRTGCKVIINQEVPAGEPAVVQITGRQTQVDEVKDLINRVIENGPQSISVGSSMFGQFNGNSAAVVSDQLEMPKDKVGITIGAKGVVIQEIMRRSCCKIIIDQDVPEGSSCKAMFTGLPNQIEAAKAMVLSVMTNGPSILQMGPGGGYAAVDGPTVIQEIPIEQTNVGKILGPGGTIIKDLQSRFGVKMKIEPSATGPLPDSKVVRISGDAQRVRAATQNVYDIINVTPDMMYMHQGTHHPSSIRAPHGYSPAHQAGNYYAAMPHPSSPPRGLPYASESIIPVPQGTLGLGADGTSGQLFPVNTMPNGLHNQVAVIRNDQAGRVVGKGMSTLNLIKTKSGAELHLIEKQNSEGPCEINIIGMPRDVRLAGQMIQEALTGGISKIQAMPDAISSYGYPDSQYAQQSLAYGQQQAYSQAYPHPSGSNSVSTNAYHTGYTDGNWPSNPYGQQGRPGQRQHSYAPNPVGYSQQSPSAQHNRPQQSFTK